MAATFPTALPPPHSELVWLDAVILARALEYSRQSPRGRIIVPFHKSDADPLHRMLNAIQPHSYVCPHRHLDPPKAEAWVVLQGALAFFTFDEHGTILECSRIAAGESRWGVDLAPGIYHGLLALEPDTVLYEVKTGPYAATSDKEFAAFAPREGAPEAEAYRCELVKAYEARQISRLAQIAWRPPVLETPRLILRGYEPSDAAAIFAYASDPEATRYMAWDTHASLTDTRTFLSSWVAEAYRHKQLSYAICLREHPERVIGGVGVLNRDDASSYELGYVLSRDLWGRGLMLEAAKRVLDQLFSHTKAVRVSAPIFADNKKSRRLAEKLGMQLEGVLRSTRERYGERKDEAVYSLLRSEWLRYSAASA